MSAHTPGPWQVVSESRWVYVTTKNATRAICQVPPASDEAKANARLIAAAPELLKVLEMVRDTLPHIGGNASSVHSMLRDISAAIAQAGGESNV